MLLRPAGGKAESFERTEIIMKQERLFYLDFVRAIAAISIILTHFNAKYLYLNPPAPEKAVITTRISNLYIGDWGVSLFFIISGAALMYVYADRCELKSFYKKRFLSIYPMFWMAYIGAFCFMFYVNRSVIRSGIPKWRMLFSVLGLDGLLLSNGVETYYILGEWFLGVIVMLYILFPLIRKLLNEKPELLLVLTVLLYAGGIALCEIVPYPIAASTLIFVRLPEVVFGMIFVKYGWKVNWKAAVGALAVLVLNGMIKPTISSSIQTTYVGIASFLVLVFMSYYLNCGIIKYICGLLSKYSYAIFLVHHIIITKMTERFDLTQISKLHSHLLFITICPVIAFFAWALYHVHSKIMSELKKIDRVKC